MKIRLNKRNTNFSPSDIKLLLALVGERKSIINCKKTDRMNTQIKEDSWQAIQNAFNAKSSVFRTYRELKKKYENIKSMAKKQTAEGKVNTFIANGNDNEQTLSAGMLCVQPNISAVPDNLIRNSSKENNHDNTDRNVKDGVMKCDIEDGEDSVAFKNSSNLTKLNKHGAKMMNKNPSSIEITDFYETASTWTKLANVKTKLIEDRAQAEINMLREEHLIKMRHLEERHRMEMEKTAIELEILKANLALKRQELGENVVSGHEQYIKSLVEED